MKSRRFAITTAVVILAIGAVIWWNGNQSSEKSGSLNFSAAEPTESVDTTASGSITHLVTIGDQAYTVELASTVEEQALGLSNRDDLDENSGMLFPFTPAASVSFWMKDMRFAIDIVWIANGKIVGIEKNAPAPLTGTETQDLPTYRPPQPVDYVLELNAGRSQFFNIGDNVIITRIQST